MGANGAAMIVLEPLTVLDHGNLGMYQYLVPESCSAKGPIREVVVLSRNLAILEDLAGWPRS